MINGSSVPGQAGLPAPREKENLSRHFVGGQPDLEAPTFIKFLRSGKQTKLVLPYRSGLALSTKSLPLALTEAITVVAIVATAIGLFVYERWHQGVTWLFEVGSLLVFGLGIFSVITVRMQSNYFRNGKTYSTVSVGERRISISEGYPLSFFSFRFDVLKICRMRITTLPNYFFQTRQVRFPNLWISHPFQHSGQQALVAEDENGNVLYPIAVAYPDSVLMQLAIHLQQLLAHERNEHWRYVISVRPDLANRIAQTLVPIIEDRGGALPVCQSLPGTSTITAKRSSKELEINVPWSNALEELTITVNPQRLNIRRKNLLSEICLSIPSGSLVEVAVYPVGERESDHALLRVRFTHKQREKLTTLELMRDFRIEEVCWVGRQLVLCGPPISNESDISSKPNFQFGTLQLFMVTTWMAIVCGCFYFDPYWGWLTALHIIVLLVIAGSMFGYRPLGQPAMRSWTKLEIIIISSILAGGWLLRLLMYLSA